MKAGIGDWGFGIREASACVELSSWGHRVGPGPPELDAGLGVGSNTGIRASGFGIGSATAREGISSCGPRVGPGPPQLDPRLGATRVWLAGVRAVRVCHGRSSARTSTRVGGHGGPEPTLLPCGALPTFGNPKSQILNPTLPRQLQGRGHGGPGPTLCVHGELSTYGNPESRIPSPALPRERQGRGHGGPGPTLCVHGELSTYGNPQSPIPNPVLPPMRQDPRAARQP